MWAAMQASPQGSQQLWSQALHSQLQQQAPPGGQVSLLNVAATAPAPTSSHPPQAVVLAQTSLAGSEGQEDQVLPCFTQM